MTDNLEKVLDLMDFKSADDFYYLQILQRKKENPELGSNSRVIKNYYIRSKEQLINRYDEIKSLCEVFNARASFRINKRSFTKVAFKAMCNLANTIHNGDFRHVGKAYDRACGQNHNEPNTNKKWIVDIDDNELWFIEAVKTNIRKLQKDTPYKILDVIPSKSGYHIICNPFRVDKFGELYPNIDIQKDNPTNLYIP